jgi:hypothetical protein
MRSAWHPRADYLLVDCGPHGTMNCGHAHADVLAIDVAARGVPIIVDPGTFTYTADPALRDLFRSSAMHSTVTVDGQGSSVPGGPFQWRHVATGTMLCWHDHPRFTHFAGRHDGYSRLPDPVLHERALLFLRGDYWLVLDRISARDRHRIALHFHFGPDVRVVLAPDAQALTAVAGTAALDVVPLGGTGVWSRGQGWTSPAYARREQAPVASYGVDVDGDATLWTLLAPRNEGEAPLRVSSLDGSGHPGEGWQIVGTACRDVLRCAPAIPAEGAHASDFGWIWMRQQLAASGGMEAVLLHGTTFVGEDCAIAFDGPVAYAVVRSIGNEMSIDMSPSRGVTVTMPRSAERLLLNGSERRVAAGESTRIGSRVAAPLRVMRDEVERCCHVRD